MAQSFLERENATTRLNYEAALADFDAGRSTCGRPGEAALARAPPARVPLCAGFAEAKPLPVVAPPSLIERIEPAGFGLVILPRMSVRADSMPLFKYAPATAIAYFNPCTLRFSPPGEFNDPFDGVSSAAPILQSSEFKQMVADHSGLPPTRIPAASSSSRFASCVRTTSMSAILGGVWLTAAAHRYPIIDRQFLIFAPKCYFPVRTLHDHSWIECSP